MKNRLMINMHLVSKANTRPAVSEIGYAIFNEREVVQVGRISIDLTKYRSSQGFEIDGASVANYYSNLVETPEIKGRVSPEDAAETLVALYEVYDCCQVWDERMNSPIENIEPMIRASSANMPWKPHNVMDFRTVQQVMPHILIDVPNAFTIQGQAHWRAQYLIEVFNRTKWFGEFVDDGNTWNLLESDQGLDPETGKVWQCCAEFSFETSDISGHRSGNNETHEITMNLYTDQDHVIQVLSEKGETIFEIGGTDTKVRIITEGSIESTSLANAFSNYSRLLKHLERDDAEQILEAFDRVRENYVGAHRKGTWLLDPNERVLDPQQNKDLTGYLDKAKKPGQ